MYPLSAETHTDAGTLRLERIDRPADSRNEVRIPPGHTVDGLPVRATLNGRVLWRALFACGEFESLPHGGVWFFSRSGGGLVFSAGALYRLDALDVHTAVTIARGISQFEVSEAFRVAVFCEEYDCDIRIFRQGEHFELHRFEDSTDCDFTIRDGAVVGSYRTYHSWETPIPFRIELERSVEAPSFLKSVEATA